MAGAAVDRAPARSVPREDADEPRPVAVPLLVLVVLTALVRLTIVEMWPPDLDVTIQRDGRPASEEILHGVAAHDVLNGPLIPFGEHRTNDFTGGSLVASVAAIPFFAVLGSSLFALRASTLVFSCGAAISAFLLLDRTVGRRAAWIGGILLALSPPALEIQSSMLYGTHARFEMSGDVRLAWDPRADVLPVGGLGCFEAERTAEGVRLRLAVPPHWFAWPQFDLAPTEQAVARGAQVVYVDLPPGFSQGRLRMRISVDGALLTGLDVRRVDP